MHHLSHIESILLAVIHFSWHYWFNFFQGPRNLAIHPWSLLLALQMFVPRNPKSLGSGSSESLMWAARKFGSNWAEAAPGGVWRAPPTSAGRDPVVSNPIWYLDHHLFWGMSNRVSLQLCAWYIHWADELSQLGSKYCIPMVFISQACFRIVPGILQFWLAPYLVDHHSLCVLKLASTFICQCQCDF